MSEKIDLALNEDIALPMIVEADRHELVAGEEFSVDVSFLGKPAVPVKYTVDTSSLLVPKGWNVTTSDKSDGDKRKRRQKLQIQSRNSSARHAADLTRRCDSPVPAAVGAHRASKIEIDGYSFALAQTVESLKATTTGIDTYPLEFVPAVTLTPDPQQIMVPAEARLATAHAAYPRPLPWNETCKSFSGS